MEKLALKTKLFETRAIIKSALGSSKLTLEEREVYTKWLQSVEDMISICTERNKF